MDHSKVLLNLGCGNSYHSDWVNLDLLPQSPEVTQADISKGIPYLNASVDVVYHSHLLEHLTRPDSKQLIADCFRVLKPGGTLRVAVPDLEQIAKQYLLTLETAWKTPSQECLANHNWMQLELLDQILRKESGGEMGPWLTNPDIPNKEFVLARIGNEIHNAHNCSAAPKTKTAFWPAYFAKLFTRLRNQAVRLLLGKKTLKQLEVSRFRESGEIHQWMYDRVALRELLSDAGFTRFRICNATQSQIQNFNHYQLDSVDSRPVKPDSIFVEADKPSDPAQGKAPHKSVA
jgi:SAM-dependent methyltransferase